MTRREKFEKNIWWEYITNKEVAPIGIEDAAKSKTYTLEELQCMMEQRLAEYEVKKNESKG